MQIVDRRQEGWQSVIRRVSFLPASRYDERVRLWLAGVCGGYIKWTDIYIDTG